MNCYLLMTNPNDPAGAARALRLQLQLLQTSPGGEDIAVSFRPNRSDDLHNSAKESARLSYRILFREGIVRSQLVVRFQVSEAPDNIVGRSSDLALALAILVEAYQGTGRNAAAYSFPTIAATGALGPDGSVRSVENVLAKLRAALKELGTAPATVFFPAENLADIDLAALRQPYPDIQLVPIGHVDEALDHLGIVLERVYLRNPFRGLEHFEYEHHSIFFGRDTEIRDLVKQLLRREQMGTPGLLVEGPSGSGKSSFLRAGVLPALVDPRHESTEVRNAMGMRPVSNDVRRAIWRPGLMPVGVDELGIARSIRASWAALSEWSVEWQVSQDVTLAELAKNRLIHWPAKMRFVWLIDQFEEILDLRLKDTVVDAFSQFLAQLQMDGVWTLASIRADATAQLKRYEALRSVFGANEGQYYLATLRGLALDDVISLPARAADLTFGIAPDGTRLDQLLREEAYREPDSLPLLQFTLNELYLKRQGRELTHVAYRELGGLAGSITTTAERIFETPAAGSPQTMRRIFRSLVSVGETGRVTRRYAPIAEIDHDASQKELLLRLVAARLCVTDQRDGEAVVAFAHDSLLSTLGALTEWLKEEGTLLQTRELVRRETQLWIENRKSVAWLATSDKVVAFGELATAGIPLPVEVKTFIERSERQVRRTRHIRQLAVGAIATLAVAASIGAWVAIKKEREAEKLTATAQRAQLQLLTEAAAERLTDGDMIFARGIILEVLKRRATSDPPDSAAINVLQEIRASDQALAIFTGHRGVVRSVAYSPDGSRIVTASHDGTARVWDARTGIQLQVLTGHTSGVRTAAFSPDGSQILTASSDGTARIWDGRTGSQLLILKTPEKVYFAAYSADGARIVTSSTSGLQIWSAHAGMLLTQLTAQPAGIPDEGFAPTAVFSPDGTRIVATAVDHTARVWDVRTGTQLLVLRGHRDTLMPAAYSPNGTRILTCSYDSTARIWDASTGAQLTLLSGPKGYCFGAAYSPDGRNIATALGDKTARIWDANTGKQLRVLSGHVDLVGGAAFSPDGRYLATSGWDRTVRTWDLRDHTDGLVMAGHGNQVTSVAYSPDGRYLVTASADHTARIWDAGSGTPLRVLEHAGSVASAVYSLDGSSILTASDDQIVRIWDAHTGSRMLSMNGPDRAGPAVFSPDGKRILTAYANFTFDIHDAQTGILIGESRAVHRNFISAVAYSPDGTRILTASMDKTARIWDAQTLTQLAVLPHKDLVNQATYSPDGKLIVTVSCDSLAHVWDARSATEIRVLAGHHAYVYSVAFSPDGRRIITGSDDQSVRIWDAATGVQLAVIAGHGARVQGLRYSPDGAHIASASVDGTARIWDATVPADWNAQVLWERAVEADLLSDVQGTQLGIPSTLASLANSALETADQNEARLSGSAAGQHSCGQQAGSFYDPDRITPGVEQASIVADIAVPACIHRGGEQPASGQLAYHAGRALLAGGDFAGARREFERAVSKGYRVARVDLGRLLVDPDAKMLDPYRAASLFDLAWKSGIPIAGFELGALYERGIPASAGAHFALNQDSERAWFWYRAAAGQNEPNSLARLAERVEDEVITASASRRDALLLEAFTLYARAAERARAQEWPDGAWRSWRYRRSTLARLLAAGGMMQETASAYKSVLDEKMP
jgi:WD40 repeat protein